MKKKPAKINKELETLHFRRDNLFKYWGVIIIMPKRPTPKRPTIEQERKNILSDVHEKVGKNSSNLEKAKILETMLKSCEDKDKAISIRALISMFKKN